MHHQDEPQSTPAGNRPAKGARIVDSQAGLGAEGPREGAVDFLGLAGLELAGREVAPPRSGAAVQDELDLVLGDESPLAPPSASRASLLQPEESGVPAATPARQPASFVPAPRAASASSARKAGFAVGLLVVAALGGGALWSWRSGAAPEPEPAVVAPARPAPVRPTRRAESASAPNRQGNLTAPAPSTFASTPSAQEEVFPTQPEEPLVAQVEPAPSSEPTAVEPTVVELAPPVASAPEPARVEEPAPAPTQAVAPNSSSTIGAAPHASIAARLQLERRFAARHGRSPLATASVLPRATWPAGDGSSLAPIVPVAEEPRLVRDFAPAEPSVLGGPRRVALESLGHVHQGADIPLEAMRGAKRLLTPKVGEVRVLLLSGETFEGRLHALGEGGAWLDTDLGRMLLHASQVRGIEALASTPADAGAKASGLLQLPRVRVVCAGGVFSGALVSRQGDEVVLATDEGSRIKLKALKVEPVSREGTQLRGRLGQRPKD
jgi:hypothetical protein